MLEYNIIISVICIIFMLLLLFIFAISLLSKSKTRAEKIEFIRSFKKGKFALIYFAMLPLYFIGRLFGGERALYAIFGSFCNVVRLVVLQYDVSNIKLLFEQNVVYSVAVTFGFVLVGLNALLLTLSLTIQRISEFFNYHVFIYSKKEKTIIIGYNEESLSVYDSCSVKNKILSDLLTDTQKDALYMRGAKYYDAKTWCVLGEFIKRALKNCNEKLNVVINTVSDEDSILLCRLFSEYINGDGARLDLSRISVFVYGNPLHEQVYLSFVRDSNGCLHYINKYQRIAIDFIDKYPFARFMDETRIDYSTALVKNDVNVNAVFVGFGKTNQQVFLTSVANNQFVERVNGEIALKPVTYYVFDKRDTRNDRNLNHGYYRYKKEVDVENKEKYLPLPEFPAKEVFRKMDINDQDFYVELSKICTANPLDSNFIIIAVGKDLENIDICQKLLDKKREWGLDNLQIFVKVRNFDVFKNCKSVLGCELDFDYDGDKKPLCYAFGLEDVLVYNYENLINEKFSGLAKFKNLTYAVESYVTYNKLTSVDLKVLDEIKTCNDYVWHKKYTQLERDSNLYACLSIRSKLNMLGFDYAPKSSELTAVSADEYMRIYGKGYMPDTKYFDLRLNGKPVVFYSMDFAPSLRTTLALHEHYRWNSYMISKGIIPATIEQILTERKDDGKGGFTNGKNYALRRHGNITTMQGLYRFAQMIAERDGKTVAECDVIKYDYQLMDDVYYLLDFNGYKIVKK